MDSFWRRWPVNKRRDQIRTISSRSGTFGCPSRIRRRTICRSRAALRTKSAAAVFKSADLRIGIELRDGFGHGVAGKFSGPPPGAIPVSRSARRPREAAKSHFVGEFGPSRSIRKFGVDDTHHVALLFDSRAMANSLTSWPAMFQCDPFVMARRFSSRSSAHSW